jgi:hypothetical protein
MAAVLEGEARLLVGCGILPLINDSAQKCDILGALAVLWSVLVEV